MRIVIHPLTIFLFIILTARGLGFLLFVYLLSVVLHELAHSFVAKKRGYALGRINILPYGASIEGSSQDMAYADEIAVSLAGPLFNLLVCLFFVAFWWLVPLTFYYTEIIVIANLSLAVFNLLPIFPLDGGRVVLALLSLKLKRELALKISKIIGLAFALTLFLIFLFGVALWFFGATGTANGTTNLRTTNFYALLVLGLVSIFLTAGVLAANKNDNYKRAIGRLQKYKRARYGLICRDIIIDYNLTLGQALRRISNSYYYNIIIVDENFKQLKTITEDELEQHLINYGFNKQLRDV
ncbi:MAG: site-2 protease family protein [Firmicutes bacterium]|nr:site-2 protease family protein [Bacillota bacterium]